MRAIVTGGAGFIGSNVVDGLLDGGHEVVVVDDLSTGRRANLEDALAGGAELREEDVRDGDALSAVCAGADVIFHLAAQIDVRRSVADPRLDADINVGGMIAVLEAAREHGVGRVVFSSTGGALYGDADVFPTAEDAPIRALSPYGQGKFAAEGYCGLYGRLHGVSTTILRYSNVYGPRQDPLGEGGVIAIFCGLAATGGRPSVFGDGRQTRDFVYVGDVVAANLRAAEAGVTGAFNVGTGVETSVLDLVEALRLHAAGAWEAEMRPPRPGEVERSVLDPAHARDVLGWAPKVALQEGLERTLAAVSSA